MIISFGKHQGTTVALAVLKDPDYILWLLGQQGATGPLASVRIEAGHLISVFDAKPIKDACRGHNCQNQAVRFSAYHGGLVDLYPWCDTCDEHQAGAMRSRLSIVKTYMQALNHVDSYFGSRRADYQRIIRNIASAKGLPDRCGEKQAQAFFA